MGLGKNPDGIAPHFRGQWEPLGRDRIALTALTALVAWLATAWLLRLGDLINGWTFLGGALVVAVALRTWASVRQDPVAEPEIPVEWWGVRRDWRPEDGEVLARGVAAS